MLIQLAEYARRNVTRASLVVSGDCDHYARLRVCQSLTFHRARCIRDKHTCDGYDPPKTWIFCSSQEGSTDPSTSRSGSSEISVSRNEDRTDLTTVRESSTDYYRLPPDITTSNGYRLQSDFLLEPSSLWSPPEDQIYTQFFLFKVAPLLSTTRAWHHFWQSIVPQAAWATPSIHHAMIAVAATYESSISGTDRTELVARRTNQATLTFSTEASPSSLDTALIVCRLFSSMAQCNEDWRTATMHMANGEKILREAARSTDQRSRVRRSEIARLMAPTLLGQASDTALDTTTITSTITIPMHDTNSDIDNDDAVVAAPRSKDQSLRDLKAMASAYTRVLRSVTQPRWRHQMADGTLGLLSVAFSTVNQALGSALDPDVLAFSAEDGDPIVPAAQVQRDLLASGALMASLDDLKVCAASLFHDLRAHRPLTRAVVRAFGLNHRLRVFVDNFVVHTWYLEPRMTAGTFWLDDEDGEGTSVCAIDRQLHRTLGISPQIPNADDKDDPMLRERKHFYLEHVCQYRSGFMC